MPMPPRRILWTSQRFCIRSPICQAVAISDRASQRWLLLREVIPNVTCRGKRANPAHNDEQMLRLDELMSQVRRFRSGDLPSEIESDGDVRHNLHLMLLQSQRRHPANCRTCRQNTLERCKSDALGLGPTDSRENLGLTETYQGLQLSNHFYCP